MRYLVPPRGLERRLFLRHQDRRRRRGEPTGHTERDNDQAHVDARDLVAGNCVSTNDMGRETRAPAGADLRLGNRHRNEAYRNRSQIRRLCR